MRNQQSTLTLNNIKITEVLPGEVAGLVDPENIFEQTLATPLASLLPTFIPQAVTVDWDISPSIPPDDLINLSIKNKINEYFITLIRFEFL